MKIAVLGAGIVGVTTAYELLRDGHEVELIDRQPGVAMECSFANGGLVAVSQAVPWSAPGVPTKTIIGMLGAKPPILLHPRELPRVWRWGLDFLLQSRRTVSWENTKHVLRLSLYSHEMLKQTRAREALQYDGLAKGTLKVYSEAATLEEAIAVSDAQVPLGLTYRRLSRDECVAMVPALAPRAATLVGGIHYYEEESGDCHAFAVALAERCRELGGTVSLSTNVQRIEARNGRIERIVTDKGDRPVDAVVLAAGAESPRLARPLGIRLPIIPIKGYSLTLERSLWPDAPDMPVLDEKRKFGYAPLGTDRLRMTGFAEIMGYDTTPQRARLEAFFAAFKGLFPQLESRVRVEDLEPFCCLRPVTPNGPPILGASRIAGLFYNVGQGHLGWTLAHGSARIVADVVSGRSPAIDTSGYLPSTRQ